VTTSAQALLGELTSVLRPHLPASLPLPGYVSNQDVYVQSMKWWRWPEVQRWRAPTPMFSSRSSARPVRRRDYSWRIPTTTACSSAVRATFFFSRPSALDRWRKSGIFEFFDGKTL